jgi:hypothetical protein
MTRLSGLSASSDDDVLASSYRRRTRGTKYAAQTATTNATIKPVPT